MKITTADGMVFEGTLAEYEEFLAFAERKVAEVEAAQAPTTITFEGAEYRKVDRDAREGDVVVLTGDNLPNWFTKGKAYKVNAQKEITEDNGEYDNYEVYSEGYGRTRETVDVYEPAVKAEPTPKFAVGDYAKVVKSELGNEGNIVQITDDSDGLRMRKANGDIVDADYLGVPVGDTDVYGFTTDQLIKATAEEVKWAKLGRKVGEFRKGDVIEVIGKGDKGPYRSHTAQIGEFLMVEEVWEANDGRPRTSKGWILPEYAELIAPVESLFTQN